MHLHDSKGALDSLIIGLKWLALIKASWVIESGIFQIAAWKHSLCLRSRRVHEA